MEVSQAGDTSMVSILLQLFTNLEAFLRMFSSLFVSFLR